MIGRQPQRYLRGSTEETDIYAFSMPKGWNYAYFSQLLAITRVTLKERLTGLISAHPEIEAQTGLFCPPSMRYGDYGNMRGCLSDMYRVLSLATDYDFQLREEGSDKSTEAADTGRELIREMMNTLTGYMEKPLSDVAAARAGKQ